MACATGYRGTLCAVCEEGFFEQFGECVSCDASEGLSVLVLIGVLLVLMVAGALLFKLRDIMPMDHLKVLLSMGQIIASGNTVYAIPWPPLFRGFLNGMRVFLIEIVSLTRANCTQPLSFYTGMVATLVVFKVVLVAIVVGPMLVHKLCQRKRLSREVEKAWAGASAKRVTLGASPESGGGRRLTRGLSTPRMESPRGSALSANSALASPSPPSRKASRMAAMGVSSAGGLRQPRHVSRRRSSAVVAVETLRDAFARAKSLPWAEIFKTSFLYLFVTCECAGACVLLLLRDGVVRVWQTLACP